MKSLFTVVCVLTGLLQEPGLGGSALSLFVFSPFLCDNCSYLNHVE